MKILRMYDRESRGEWDFATVEIQTTTFWGKKNLHSRRVARRGSPYFRFMDTGELTPSYDVESLWNDDIAKEKAMTFAEKAQAAYLME